MGVVWSQAAFPLCGHCTDLGRAFAGEGTLMGHQTGDIWIPLQSTGVPLPDHWHFAASWPLSI